MSRIRPSGCVARGNRSGVPTCPVVSFVRSSAACLVTTAERREYLDHYDIAHADRARDSGENGVARCDYLELGEGKKCVNNYELARVFDRQQAQKHAIHERED